MEVENNNFDDVIEFYKAEETQSLLDQFLNQVEHFFRTNPTLKKAKTIHSIKSRQKDPEHLRDKLMRKYSKGYVITKETLLKEITDLEDWKLVESPKAYTWEKESQQFFEDLGIKTEVKDTYYTSVHYVVKPNNAKSDVTCEIQVRTLFEEIWGEIDHTINYPHATNSIACKEQIRVLAKLVSTGTRLADSIFRTYDEYKSNNTE